MISFNNIQVFLIILLMSFSSLKLIGQSYNTLFIGNSYTYVNDLPQLISGIASSFGDTLNYDTSTPGGSTFNAHSTNSTTLTKISQQQWDYVILQAQSQEPSFSPGQVASQTYPYAAILVDSIESNSSCTEAIFFMTWGRKYGDQMNCAAYPPICTYLGMQQRLRESYLDMTLNHNATCSPVGMSWKESIAQDSTINLYTSDNSHPSIYGSYLAACTFYATIFKESPIGSTYIPNGIGHGTAVFLQTIASNTVLDSLSTWNIFNTDFSTVIIGDSVEFTNLSSNYESVLWNFGDGTQSILDNPSHVYLNSGIYNVKLTTFTNNSCISDIENDTITITSTTAIEELKQEKKLIKITDILGRDTRIKKNVLLIYIYDDGSIEKRVILD